MRQQNDERELMRAYLLGSLDGERLEQVEVRLLSDSQFQDRLHAAEDEVVDDYAFGALSSSDRERFEQHFLSTPERLEKVRFAKAVKGYIGNDSALNDEAAGGRALRWRTVAHSPGRRKLLASVTIAACALTALVVGALIWREVRERQANREQNVRAEIEREVALWTREPPVGGGMYVHYADITLTPGILREAVGTRRIVIAQDTLAAQLRIELTEQRFESYEVTLFGDNDVIVFALGQLRPQKDTGDKIIVLRIPAKYLPAGDYELRLRGTTGNGDIGDAGSYPFQVVHRSASP